MEACITNYGARVVALMTPDRNGKLEDVVCGFSNIHDYISQSQNYGATVGRYIGRILNAQYTLDGKTYHLQANHLLGHTAHGGDPNFGARMWKVTQATPSSITLNYLSPDGENGFPGNLNLFVTYTITEDNALDIRYEATTDKPTVLNLCNHSFFNISGNLNQNIENQTMWVDADYFSTYDRNKCVTGELWPVDSTPLDFREPHLLSEHINDNYGQLNIVNGYDHAWALNHPGDDTQPAAWIYDKVSGRKMEIYTTEPAIHIYTGNGLKGKTFIILSVQLYVLRLAISRTVPITRNSPPLSYIPEIYSKAIQHINLRQNNCRFTLFTGLNKSYQQFRTVFL